MRIDATGCVGIDTTTPNERLTVKGNISACGNVFANNNVYSGNKLFVFGGSTAAGNYICNNSSGDTTFFTNGGERMTIENAGNVGIGTTAPSEKLTVVGNISACGVLSAADAIRVPDSTCITLGNSEDLKLYHDGSNSYLNDTGTGDLIIKGGNDICFKASSSVSCKIYHK
jgi:hypothetical protein